MSTTVDLRKRYVDLRTGKVNLYKVVLSKGVKG